MIFAIFLPNSLVISVNIHTFALANEAESHCKYAKRMVR